MSTRIGVAGICLILLGALSVWIGVPEWLESGVLRLEGHSVILPGSSLHVDLEPGKDGIVRFPVKNITGSEIAVVGAKTDCGCVTCDDLPQVLPRYGTSYLQFRIIPTGGTEDEHHFVDLFVNRRSPRLRIEIVARHRPPSQ